MHCVVSSFWSSRPGCRAEHYEDAFFPRASGPHTAPRLRLAVADGASESMLSGLWADLLVRTWCRSRSRHAEQVVAAAMSAWNATLVTYLEGREAERRPIEWFEQPGLDRGAHATLLGVELSEGPPGAGGRWSAVSLGDSCVFHVRGDALARAFPMESAAGFGNAPKLVPTRPGQLRRVVAALDHADGDWVDGDVLYLATDAVAAWFLAAASEGRSPWRDLAALPAEDDAAFAAWADGERAGGRLRNDDLTLVRVEVARVAAAPVAGAGGPAGATGVVAS